VTMKNVDFWDVALCRSCVNIRFAPATIIQNDKFHEHVQWARLRKIVLDDGQIMVETCVIRARNPTESLKKR
jgi:hypothetical protein